MLLNLVKRAHMQKSKTEQREDNNEKKGKNSIFW
jgi:hypothetical protein